MKLVILGAPGAGKGTQAEFISEKFNIPQISTGNIIREAIKNNTKLGKAAEPFIDEGKLVPDEIVIGMVKERISHDDCDNGYILDGFPRTVEQAKALKDMGVRISKVLDIEVDDDEILTRLSGRRVCELCGHSYHIVYKPPIKDGKCDACEGCLVIREDDAVETIKKRLAVYHEQTEPVKEFYKMDDILHVIVGQEKVEDTQALTLKVLEA